MVNDYERRYHKYPPCPPFFSSGDAWSMAYRGYGMRNMSTPPSPLPAPPPARPPSHPFLRQNALDAKSRLERQLATSETRCAELEEAERKASAAAAAAATARLKAAEDVAAAAALAFGGTGEAARLAGNRLSGGAHRTTAAAAAAANGVMADPNEGDGEEEEEEDVVSVDDDSESGNSVSGGGGGGRRRLRLSRRDRPSGRAIIGQVSLSGGVRSQSMDSLDARGGGGEEGSCVSGGDGSGVTAGPGGGGRSGDRLELEGEGGGGGGREKGGEVAKQRHVLSARLLLEAAEERENRLQEALEVGNLF